MELLIPDLNGNKDALFSILDDKPDVLNHNVETVPGLYNKVRPEADYIRSLRVLELSKKRNLIVKSGLMVGLGENLEDIHRVFSDLGDIGVDILTIGQYLSPSRNHYPVKRFLEPSEFEEFEKIAKKKGIPVVVSGPLVRSSYRAGISLNEALKKRSKPKNSVR